MHFSLLITRLLVPLAVLAAPYPFKNTTSIGDRAPFPLKNESIAIERPAATPNNATIINERLAASLKNVTIIRKRYAPPFLFKNATAISERQAPVKPKPCQPISPAPTEEETKARFDKFADAFLVKKNITAAFEYINQGYINHNPAAQNGFDSAWNILSPIWGNQQITVLRTKFQTTQGWLNYRSGFGEVVDRYRWEAGCIAEHWDQGEQFPA